MALQKQAININFNQGLDTKNDPKQVPVGNFLEMNNSVFETGGLLKKRNGFGRLSNIGNTNQTNITTYKGGLVATGTELLAYNADANSWLSKGTIQPVDINTIPLIRSSGAQTKPDLAIASNGTACSVFLESGNIYYQTFDSSNGQSLSDKALVIVSGFNPKVNILGQYFIVTYIVSIAGTPTLQYKSIPVHNPSNLSSAVSISAQVKATTSGYDCIVANSTLCIAWEGSDVGGAIRINRMNSSFVLGTATVLAGYYGKVVSICADTTTALPTLYISFFDDTAVKLYTTVYSYNQVQITAPDEVLTASVVTQICSAASDGTATIFYQVGSQVSRYSMPQAGPASSPTLLNRDLYISSKPFIKDSIIYFLTLFSSNYQPTYFLINSDGEFVAKLAASNAGSTGQLSSISSYNGKVFVSYEFKDLLVSVNKTQGAATSAGIYTETGISMALIDINNSIQTSSEISSSLHLTGGILWQYDGSMPVEHSFVVYPENVSAVASNGAGSLTAQQYYYAVCYEWTDSAGNIHRSAPSVPIGVNLVGPNDTITLTIPTLKLTYKTSVRIVIYRWSAAQQVYYQVSSVASPTLNNPAVDSVTFVDEKTDAQILGNTILYTTGGVLENIASPPSFSSIMYKNRLFLADAEDRNLIWYSKIVLSGTPVEMTDLQTIYIAPTTGTQGSTGDITALSAMDDKLIIFKKNAIYYLTGNGPDATGANNDFSEPVFITGAVGCSEISSIVLMPMGLMFKSTKGIWLLGRDLSTKYIGAPIEAFNNLAISSANSIPNVNEVRFTLTDSNYILSYNYFFNQWSTFSKVNCSSSCIYSELHTILTPYGTVLQETPGLYLDDSRPVLMNFTTAWFKLTGLQGFQRAYFFTILGEYITAHKLAVKIAYDYIPNVAQLSVITPPNMPSTYGSDSLYGSGNLYGGDLSQEQYRIFLKQQKCQAIRLTIEEQYDSSKGEPAGAGFSMSGINLVVGAKGINQKVAAKQSVG